MKNMTAKLEQFLDGGGISKDVVLLLISALALLGSMIGFRPLPFDTAWVAIVLCGFPIVLNAIIGLVTAFDIKADVLVSLALIAAVCIGEIFAAAEVALIMQLGALLEDLTVARARSGIEKLVRLTPQTARVLRDGSETIVPATQVNIDDRLRVLPGEAIPVDGIIISGQTAINQAVMTGESLPVDKTVGDAVASGTVNQFGAFEMKATKVDADSSVQRMIRLVQSADAGKAKIVGLADRWATVIVIAALTAAVLTWLVTGQLIRAVTILVVFCPCSLVLATPTAIMAAIGNATRHGFLVREGDALERLAKVSRITFDKTGTLTYGTLQVTAVKSVSAYADDEVYALVAAVEQLSVHPLGKAIRRCYQQHHRMALPEPTGFRIVPGQGVAAVIENKAVVAGNPKMLVENGAQLSADIAAQTAPFLARGSTVIYLAVDTVLAGYLVLSDTVRCESGAMIDRLQALGVSPVLLTGDNEQTAAAIANQLLIGEVRANCLPEDKLHCISRYQERHEAVCMIGDGINDAPALKKADVGIAMGGIGSDIAVEAADIALVDDEVRKLPHLFALSKRMMKTIKLNLTFSLTLNFIAVTLAMTGILNPIVGALVHNAGSVLVIINSALVYGIRDA
jgi:heavy metal translocating P-type ATPase